VDSLKDGSVLSNVTGWGQTETTDETSGEIGEDITVQVGHNHYGVGERSGVGSDLHFSNSQNVGSAAAYSETDSVQ